MRRMKKRKGIETLRMKYPTPFRAIETFIGDEEQNGKQKKEQKEKHGAGLQPRYPRQFSRLLRHAGIIW